MVAFAKGAEVGGEGVFAAQVVAGELGQREGVVPVAAGRLQSFVVLGGGERVPRAWCAFGDVAGKLGGFAEVVEAIFAETGEVAAARKHAVEDGAGVGEELGNGECEGVGGLEGGVERFERGGEASLAFADEVREVRGGAFAAMGEVVEEFIEVVLVVLAAEVVGVDVEVADVASGLAEALELAAECGFFAAVRRETFELVEQEELGFDAAGLGAEFVDDAFAWVGEGDGESGFEGAGVLAEGLDGSGGDGEHPVDWMPTIAPRGTFLV